MYTRHAETRSQQRGIPPLLIDLLLELGTSEKVPGGARKFYFDKRSRRQLQAYAGPLAKAFGEHLGVYAIVSSDDVVITVGHRIDRIKKH